MAATDQQLIRRTLENDTQAFGELVQRYSGLVHGVVRGMVRHCEEVEDLVQEVFCKSYEELPRLRRPSRFAPWLGQIARRTVLRYLRQRQTWNRAETELEKIIPFSSPSLPDEDLETSEQADLLWDALGRLDPDHRRLLVLYHLEGCTFQEIARFVDKPLTTVRWRLLQSERKLGKHLCALLGQPQLNATANKQALARKVLSALPPTLYLSSETQAASWWTLGSWPATPRLGAVASLAGSVLIHLGLGLFGSPWSDGSADSTVTRVRLTSDPAPPMERLSVQAPVLPPSPPRRLAFPISPPEPPESIKPATALAESLRTTPSLEELLQYTPSALEPTYPQLDEQPLLTADDLLPDSTSASSALDLLRLRDMARADQDRALVVTSRAKSYRFLGYVNFTNLALQGAGSFGPQLSNLSRYMRKYTGIKARIRQRPPHRDFLSDELLEDPIHFLFQGWPPPRRGAFTYFEAAEIARLGEYLRGGGTLYVEGSPPFLGEIFDHVRRALGDSTTIAPIPSSHPVYRAYYHFDSGFPGEFHKRSFAPLRHFPPGASILRRLGLWGVEVDGEVAVLFNDHSLIGGLYLSPTYFQEAVTRIRPDLAAATNIVTYALTRPQGMTARVEPPLWTRISSER